MKKVVVVGTGIMAVGIAAGFLATSTSVILLGRSKSRADEFVNEIEQLTATINPNWQDSGAQVITGEMTTWSDWNEVVWVIETVSEDMALKQKVFAMLDQRVPPHIPIGSNSSGFPISKISAGLPTANRMLNAHYFMPAHIVPLVEVVLGEKSDPAIGEQVCEMYRAAGKKPVLVKKDIPGFLANRIQHALMREALSLVQEGIASPEDIDDAVRYSFGFRYAAVGPMTQKEISGWDGMANAAKEIYPSLSNITTLPPKVVQLMSEGKTGMKSGEGFRKWTPEEIQQVSDSYSRRLKAAFDVLNIE